MKKLFIFLTLAVFVFSLGAASETDKLYDRLSKLDLRVSTLKTNPVKARSQYTQAAKISIQIADLSPAKTYREKRDRQNLINRAYKYAFLAKNHKLCISIAKKYADKSDAMQWINAINLFRMKKLDRLNQIGTAALTPYDYDRIRFANAAILLSCAADKARIDRTLADISKKSILLNELFVPEHLLRDMISAAKIKQWNDAVVLAYKNAALTDRQKNELQSFILKQELKNVEKISDPAKIMEKYHTLLQSNPEHKKRLNVDFAVILENKKAYDEAEKLWRELAVENTVTVYEWKCLFNVMEKNGRRQAALNEAQEMFRKAKKFADPLFFSSRMAALIFDMAVADKNFDLAEKFHKELDDLNEKLAERRSKQSIESLDQQKKMGRFHSGREMTPEKYNEEKAKIEKMEVISRLTLKCDKYYREWLLYGCADNTEKAFNALETYAVEKNKLQKLQRRSPLSVGYVNEQKTRYFIQRKNFARADHFFKLFQKEYGSNRYSRLERDLKRAKSGK